MATLIPPATARPDTPVATPVVRPAARQAAGPRSTASGHAYTLRAPWYVLEREELGLSDEAAKRPAIQKYATPEFVRSLVNDPRDSLQFDSDDRWSFPVPAISLSKNLRKRLTTHRLVRTPLRKLYQPSHERFYVVVVELLCDEAGLPRPGNTERLDVRCVVRRIRTEVESSKAADVRTLARLVSRDFYHRDFPKSDESGPDDDLSKDVVDMIELHPAKDRHRLAFEAEHADALAKVTLKQTVEGWVVRRADGRGRWAPVEHGSLAVPAETGDPNSAADSAAEDELTMWRIPPRAGDCTAAQTRSLWFGLVPTFSGELDVADREPKFDDRSIYTLECFVREHPPAGHEHCPPKMFWSAPSRPYRLAAFFDPDGTKNRRVRVKLPDFRVLAARAGQPPSGGGVEFERPPGSQLPPGPLGEIPKASPAGVGGATAERCTMAIELITIVASFVLALFLPIVVFVFQLWWMLLLKFCWPPNQAALNVLTAHFTAGKTIATLNQAGQDALDQIVGATGAAAELASVPDLQLAKDSAMGSGLVEALQPAQPPPPPEPFPSTKPADPLCLRPRRNEDEGTTEMPLPSHAGNTRE